MTPATLVYGKARSRSLTRRQAEALKLSEEGLTHGEIAQELGIRRQAASGLLARARRGYAAIHQMTGPQLDRLGPRDVRAVV